MNLRFVMVWLRLLVVAIFLHVGGLAAAIAVDDVCADETACCSDCPGEKSGQECPPGCPECHCRHAGGAVTIPEMHGSELARPAYALETASAFPREATALRAPAVQAIFRPPRRFAPFT